MSDEVNDKYYCIKSTQTVMEIIDGEAIMINGAKGTYYNLSPQATLILESLINGNTLKEISTFNKLDIEIDEFVEKMIRQLIKEDILIETGKKNTSMLPKKLMIKNFKKDIVLSIYSDMQDMLKLDPIHETDEIIGWPVKK
jgi:hypothetical protein